MNHFSIAKENLQEACDGGEPYRPQMTVAYTTGSAVTYFCNWEGEPVLKDRVRGRDAQSCNTTWDWAGRGRVL